MSTAHMVQTVGDCIYSVFVDLRKRQLRQSIGVGDDDDDVGRDNHHPPTYDPRRQESERSLRRDDEPDCGSSGCTEKYPSQEQTSAAVEEQ